MNYIREINAFYDWLETNELSVSAISLWYALMHINNKTGWKNEFTVALSVLSIKSGLSPRAVTNARKELTEKGRIKWESRNGNQAAQYTVNSLVGELQELHADKVADITTDKPTDKVADNCTDNATTLDKPKRKQNNKPPTPLKIKYAEFVSMTEKEYQTLVDAHGEPATKRMVEIINNYKGSTGKTYKSDYLAILNWVVKRYEEEKTKAPKEEQQQMFQDKCPDWL